jgi:alanine racemase
MIGRVAMDVVVIDLGQGRARAGDEVVFLGDPAHGEPDVADWARVAECDPVDIAASIGPRVARSYTR